MTIVPLSQIPHLKDKDAVEAVQGRVIKVFAARRHRDKAVQDAQIQDASGNTVGLGVWEHPDLSMYEGTDVIIQSGPRGGISVRWDDYKKANTLSLGKGATFQKLAVHQAQTGQASAPHPDTKGVEVPTKTFAPSVINGAKVGMAINNACNFLAQAGVFDAAQVYKMASDLIRISNNLEEGKLAPESEKAPF